MTLWMLFIGTLLLAIVLAGGLAARVSATAAPASRGEPALTLGAEARRVLAEVVPVAVRPLDRAWLPVVAEVTLPYASYSRGTRSLMAVRIS